MFTGLLALLGGVSLLAQQGSQPSPAEGQQPPPVTFRVEVNYVEVDAIVTDRQGNFVRNLTRDDFEVLEDGKPQQISVFSLVEIPIERAEQPLFREEPIEPDVRTNEREFDGRLFVIVLDDLHTHALRSTLVKRAARQFIEQHLGPNDFAAILHTSGRTDAGQEFTNNRRLLLSAVDKFMGQKLRSATAERLDEYNRQRGMPMQGDQDGMRRRIGDPLDFERGYKARNTLETVRHVAEWMNNIRGRRKAMVFISEGIDYDITDVFESREATTVVDAARRAVGAATRSNVNIYAVDPRGLASMGDEGMELGALPEDPSFGITQTSLWDELRLAQNSLRSLADETGGFAALNSNDFAGAFNRIIQENSAYYVLGYYPTNDRRDGRFRRIQVRLKQPGLQVNARKGYVAPRGRARELHTVGGGSSPELRDALNNPLPVSGLTVSAFATAFKGTPPNASVPVTVQIEGRDLQFGQKDGLFVNQLEVGFLALDYEGKVRGGDRNEVNLSLRPETYRQILENGFRMNTRLDLPPGRYQLRVGARESIGGRIGSVTYDLEVPDFARAPFSISGLALSSRHAVLAPTGRPDPQLGEILGGPITTARVFDPDDTIALFAEVYDNEIATPHKVDITTTVLSDDGRVMFKTEEERSTEELQGARGGFGHRAEIPLNELTPGLYVLRVDAQSRLGQKTAAREVQFRIRGAGGTDASGPRGKMTIVAQGGMSGIDDRREVVIRSGQDWEALWREHAPAQPPAAVDFSTQMVVGVFLGTRPTAGFQVEITGVREQDGALVVEYVERRPPSDAMVAQVLTAPFHLVTVPRHEGPVRFTHPDRSSRP